MTECPQCHAPVGVNQRFCTTCGTDLAALAGQGAALPALVMPSLPLPPPPWPMVPAPGAFPSLPHEMALPGAPSGTTPPLAEGITPPVHQMASPPQLTMSPQIPGAVAALPMDAGPFADPPPSPISPAQSVPPPTTGFESLFGASANPSVVSPTSPTQAALLKQLPFYATNPVAGAIIGAAAAVAACIMLTFVLFALITGMLQLAANATSAHGGGSTLDQLPQITNLSLLNLLGLMHGATLTAAATGSATGSANFTPPLTLLILIPILSCALGGYLSASTDYSNQLRFVLLRAAAVGPLYGVLLTLIIGIFGSQAASIAGTNVTLTIAWPSMLLASIGWGTLAGLIGGMIKIFNRRWRAGTVALLLSQKRSPVVAALVGALAAVGLGIALGMILFIFALGAGWVAVQGANAAAHVGADQGIVGTLSQASQFSLLFVLALVLLALPGGTWVFSFSSGAPVNGAAISSLFAQTGGIASQSLLNLPSGWSELLWLLLFLPIGVYFIGGRVAARLLGGASGRQQVQVGALVGVFSSLLLAILVALSDINFSGGVGTLGVGASAGGALGPSVAATFVTTLVLGCIFGALGAFYYQPLAYTGQRSPRHFLVPVFIVLDRLTGQPLNVRRTFARAWLYGSLIIAAVAIFFTLLFAGLASNFAQNMVGDISHGERVPGFLLFAAITGGVVLAVPFLGLIIALAVEIASVPPDAATLVKAVAPPAPLIPAPPSAPYQLPTSTYTAPHPMAPPSTPPTP